MGNPSSSTGSPGLGSERSVAGGGAEPPVVTAVGPLAAAEGAGGSVPPIGVLIGGEGEEVENCLKYSRTCSGTGRPLIVELPVKKCFGIYNLLRYCICIRTFQTINRTFPIRHIVIAIVVIISFYLIYNRS